MNITTCNSNSYDPINIYSHLEQCHPACTPRSSIRLPCSMISSQTPHFPARELRGERITLTSLDVTSHVPNRAHTTETSSPPDRDRETIDPTSHREPANLLRYIKARDLVPRKSPPPIPPPLQLIARGPNTEQNFPFHSHGSLPVHRVFS